MFALNLVPLREDLFCLLQVSLVGTSGEDMYQCGWAISPRILPRNLHRLPKCMLCDGKKHTCCYKELTSMGKCCWLKSTSITLGLRKTCSRKSQLELQKSIISEHWCTYMGSPSYRWNFFVGKRWLSHAGVYKAVYSWLRTINLMLVQIEDLAWHPQDPFEHYQLATVMYRMAMSPYNWVLAQQ